MTPGTDSREMVEKPLTVGAIVSVRFEVQEHLGSGEMGAVYRALDRQTGKPVALRILPGDLCADPDLVTALGESLGNVAGLQHKNLVALHDVGTEGESMYVALDLIEGQSLRDLLDRKRKTGKPFSFKGAYNVVAHLCNAISACHDKGVVHGLPGPGAVLINKSGRVKLTDLGLLPAFSARVSNGRGLRDAPCMAPEVRLGQAGPRSDLYSIGALLHELLTNQPPTAPGALPSRLVPEISPEVDRVVSRCLAEDPDSRFESAAALKTAFFEAIGGNEEPRSDVMPAPDIAPPPVPAQPPVVHQPSNPALQTPPIPPPVAASAPGFPGVPAQPPHPAGPMAPPSPFQIAQVAPPAGPQSSPAWHQPAPGPGQKPVSIQDLLADEDADPTERWLVQKDRLDFGPFSISELKRQLFAGQFNGDDTLKDQDTGTSCRIRNLPQLKEFIKLLEQHQANQEVQQAEMKRWEKEKKRRTLVMLIVAASLLVLGVGGAIAAYFMTRDPETVERIVYRDKTDEAIQQLLSRLEVTFKSEQPDPGKQPIKKRKRRPHKAGEPAGGATADGEEVTYLGDVSEEGGDARLSQEQIQRVMQEKGNFNPLVRCMLAELKNNPGMKQVEIHFGIQGTGRVSTAKVNGQTSGPFHGCITAKLRTIKFPSFAGALTPASFYMTLK